MEFLPNLLLALGAVLLGLISPGPNVLAVIGTSMSTGRPQGVALATGVATGSGLWALLAVVGFTALVTTYAFALVFIKIAGGLYLCWLGIKLLRSASSEKEIQGTGLDIGSSRLRYFWRGLTIQMTNPKAAIVMIAIVSIVLVDNTPLWVRAVLISGIAFLSFGGHVLYAIVFSSRLVVNRYLKMRRYVEAVLGVTFCFAGVRLMTSRP